MSGGVVPMSDRCRIERPACMAWRDGDLLTKLTLKMAAATVELRHLATR